MKHIIILIFLFSFAPGQAIYHKCGIIPEHEPAGGINDKHMG